VSSIYHAVRSVLKFVGILLTFLRICYVRQNIRRDKLLAEGQLQNAPEDEFADKTDLELPGFRYVVSIASS